jgi:hypothetical protein
LEIFANGRLPLDRDPIPLLGDLALVVEREASVPQFGVVLILGAGPDVATQVVEDAWEAEARRGGRIHGGLTDSARSRGRSVGFEEGRMRWFGVGEWVVFAVREEEWRGRVICEWWAYEAP